MANAGLINQKGALTKRFDRSLKSLSTLSDHRDEEKGCRLAKRKLGMCWW